MSDKLEGFVACCNCGLPLKELTEKIKTKDKEIELLKQKVADWQKDCEDMFAECERLKEQFQ